MKRHQPETSITFLCSRFGAAVPSSVNALRSQDLSPPPNPTSPHPDYLLAPVYPTYGIEAATVRPRNRFPQAHRTG